MIPDLYFNIWHDTTLKPTFHPKWIFELISYWYILRMGAASSSAAQGETNVPEKAKPVRFIWTSKNSPDAVFELNLCQFIIS